MKAVQVWLQREFEKKLAGEVRFDIGTRLLYSTDASIYQQQPLGVAFPKHSEDLAAILEIAAAHQVPLLPRGSGSSLAGQTVGEALVLDFSRWMDQVIEINPEERSAWVEPGVVLSPFNRQAGRYGLEFGPDPASADRATFGGMFGNNSTGAHSIRYGMAADHLLAVEVLFADGRKVVIQSERVEQLQKTAESGSSFGRFTAAALSIRSELADLIRERWPSTWRNSSGYALNYLLPWSDTRPPQWEGANYPPSETGMLNLASVLAGSEGTLAVFSCLKVGLVPTPNHKILAVLAFDSVAAAADATEEILTYSPAAVELVPDAILAKARMIPAYAARLSFLEGTPAALLLVEFSGDDQGALAARARNLPNISLIVDQPHLQQQLWEVRKVGLGLLMNKVGDAKPIPFIEDVAVPVESLSAFVKEFLAILADHGTSGDFYAHASAGCLHIRPVVNTKTIEGLSIMRSITATVVESALKHGGALSGEHADGQARGEWLEKVYGPEIVSAFERLKLAADPDRILNPGKIINPPSMTENLRYGGAYHTISWPTVQDFSGLEGIAGAIEMCNGAGVCRQLRGRMCPTFQATREEMHSTRGRANLLRAYISGTSLADQDVTQATFESLSLCLSCKACKAECPSAVDLARLKVEFLHQYYKQRRRPLRDYLFGYIEVFGRLGQILPGLANRLLAGKAAPYVFRMVGISPERQLPTLGRPVRLSIRHGQDEDVVLLTDPLSEYFETGLIADAIRVLGKAGCQVHRLPVVGAGRTKYSKGFLPAAARHGNRLIKAIEAIDPNGVMAIIAIEPSELAMLRDDLSVLLPDRAGVWAVAARSYSLEEFLIRPDQYGKTRASKISARQPGPAVLLHGHCQEKALPALADGFASGVSAARGLLELLGMDVTMVEAGCCGMAGSFGYEVEHVHISEQVAELAVLPAVRARKPDQIVVAAGASCRAQVDALTDTMALHPVSVLASLSD